MSNPAVAAIEFALSLRSEDCKTFLSYWNKGMFPEIREAWPEAPEEIYIGADQFHPDSKNWDRITDKEAREIIQKTYNNSMYGRDHNGWEISLVRAVYKAGLNR